MQNNRPIPTAVVLSNLREAILFYTMAFSLRKNLAKIDRTFVLANLF
ncbi:hypothetical protein [Avibacterium paragallinarum]